MKIKNIVLTNIRSYENQEINFEEGSTLLSGDIGSGKTSILLGIEFALFGLQPGQRGASILKNGKDQGGVKMTLEIKGQEIILERTLKKVKTISQDYCSITIDGEKKEISVTELKNIVLRLLNYPQEFSKKLNLLYKFTVYTPQEEMKQIILQDQETRLNTLRHVFGVDKYKRILENISIVLSKIRLEKRIKEGLAANIEQDKTNITSKETELETKHLNLYSLEKELFLATELRKKIKEEKEEISKKIEEKRKLQQEVDKAKLMISTKRESIGGNIKNIEQLNSQISELEHLNFEEIKIQELTNSITNLKEEKKKLEEKLLDLTSKITSFTFKNEDAKKLEARISKLETCPTCLQDVDPVYRANVLNNLHTNFVENNKNINSLEEEKKHISGKKTEVESEIYEKEKEITELKILKIKLQGVQEKKIRLEEIKILNLSLEKDIALLSSHMDALKNSVFELNKFDNIFESKSKELENSLKNERIAEIKVAELKREIEFFSRQIEELKESLKKSEEIKSQISYLAELEDWLSKEFAPIVSLIEKNVMVKLKSEFSKLFEKWFCMLVSDSFNVKINDDFTPIIEYQDYEIEYAYLSGGERTAVALSYRLALNQVINSLLSKIETKDLVILDEPTDGFSEQQLDRMRDVLQQLNIGQLIIVSHEQKIEEFVEHVIKIKKDPASSFVDK